MSQSKSPCGAGKTSTGGGSAGRENDSVARAEAVVAAFADEYLSWLSADLDRVEQLLASAQSDPDMVRQLRRKAHDIRGQGGSFGFPLVTKLAEALHKVVSAQQGGTDERSIALAGEVVNVMRLVVERRAKGDGDAGTRAAVETVVRNVGSDSGGA